MLNVQVLVPAKDFAASKQRLSGVLQVEERASLGEALLLHTLQVVGRVVGRVAVVTDSEEVAAVARQQGAEAIVAQSRGLNPQLAEAAARFSGPLLVLHADLPLLQEADVAALLAAPGDVVLAPDRAGTGTNALLQRQPARFFHFGPQSAVRHRAAAALRRCTTVERLGLALDLDDAQDWATLAQHFGRPLSFAGLCRFLKKGKTPG